MAESTGGGARAALLAALVVVGAVAVVVADDSDRAGAAELATFASCEELTTWMARSAGEGERLMSRAGTMAEDVDTARSGGGAAGDDVAQSAAPAPAAEEGSAASADGAGGTGSTNLVVAGIDELDRVEQLAGDRALAIGEGNLHLVDVAAARSLASVPVPPGAQVSYDPEGSVVWVAGSDGARSTVARVRLDGDALATEGSWESDGMLLTGRRSGEGFHAVLVQGYGGAVPFEGGPVPCDEVLHPTGPATPEATLLVTLPSTGDVAPAVATEIVGAGQHVHLTADAVIVATPLWEAAPATSLHRFDLATLTHTGSGRVDGSLLNEFSLSLHDGHLRVAVTHGGARFGVAVDLAEPIPVDPGIGGPVPGAPEPGQPEPPAGAALNEVVVLDTEGDLDVVGRSPRFGLPDETLHGIRFTGDTAYAVTFLQTDPFYVLDLADPAAPRVVGEVKLPGFSSYLHPIGEGFVVGFGPDGDGTVAAKLFDVTDPAAPAVADSVSLGQDSPVAWDHHAFLALGEGRFAVPATTAWEPVDPAGCTPDRRAALEQRAVDLEEQLAAAAPAEADALVAELERVWSDPCLSVPTRPVTTIVELQVAGASLQEVSRTELRSQNPGERVLRFDDRWALWAYAELVVAPDAGAPTAVPLP